MPENACQKCGAIYHVPPCRANSRYCSGDCYHAAKTTALAVRFKQYVGAPTETGCLPWTGKRSKKGYGWIKEDGRKRFVGAHRAAYILANGPIPDNAVIMHSCDNRWCVNPQHLIVGTQLDNIKDMVEKGRQARGRKLPQAVLTEADVIEIRRRAAAGETQRSLADAYAVTASAIQCVVAGKNWAAVAG
jgi:hypothetical protein